MVLEYHKIDNSKMKDINLKGKVGEDDKIENEMMKFFPNHKIKKEIEEWESINYSRLSNKIHHIVSSVNLDKVPWKDELADMFRRIVPGKTINPWQTSIRTGLCSAPTGEDLLELIRNLENDKIHIVRKGIAGTYNSVINNLDIIDFLDRDFLFIGEVKEGSDVPERSHRESDWYGTTSPYSSQTDADCICDLMTVIYNKVFYVKSIVWEMDYNDKFSKHIYFDIIVYDVGVK